MDHWPAFSPMSNGHSDSSSESFFIDNTKVDNDKYIYEENLQSMSTGSSDPNSPSHSIKAVTVCSDSSELCVGCSRHIMEQYLMKVNGQSWHMSCLRCNVCQTGLDRHETCYIKDGEIYCKEDYNKQFGKANNCATCSRTIESTDWVRKAGDNVYHLACFSCDSCKRQLSTGDEFALENNKVLCKIHYLELHGDTSLIIKPKAKRVRVAFTEDQVKILQANFRQETNPDGQDLARIAQETSLSKRVAQVWFQNARAREKKNNNKSARSSQNQRNNMNSQNISTSPQSSCGGYVYTPYTHTSGSSPTMSEAGFQDWSSWPQNMRSSPDCVASSLAMIS